MTNLLDNALRYSSSIVEVSLVAGNGRTSLTVADDGPGIAAQYREQIWGRFVRLDNHRSRPSGGSGLGLALVKDIVVAYGGRVDVTESKAGGAAFVVELPENPSQAIRPKSHLPEMSVSEVPSGPLASSSTSRTV